jgi:hypothetical protein
MIRKHRFKKNCYTPYTESTAHHLVSCLFGSASLHVLLERRSFGDRLACIFVDLCIGVASVEHTARSLLGFLTRNVIETGGAGECNRGGAKGRGTGHKGGKDSNLRLYYNIYYHSEKERKKDEM